MVFAGIDKVFAPILAMSNIASLTIFAILFSVIVIIINLLLTKKDVRDQVREQIDNLNKKFKKARKSKDVEKMQKIQEEQVKVQMENMKHNLKPTIASILIFIVLFPWLRSHYEAFSITLYPLSWSVGMLGWYILIAVTTSLVLRKVFDLR